MVKIKSYETENGDMFYIKHNSDNFTIIDCCIDEEKKDEIISEINFESKYKSVKRFISTHPDDDHIRGLKYLDENEQILNFYCVKNEIEKSPKTEDFKKYCELRDSSKAFYIKKVCSRNWMNQSTEDRGSAGINIKWPDYDNMFFLNALAEANKGESPNDISPIITYSLQENITIYWFGDMETDYMNNIIDDVNWTEADVVFAAHHGRSSGRIPTDILKKIKPKIVVIGNAPSEFLDYYIGYETITQNTAGDVVIQCEGKTADFFVSNPDYKTPPTNLKMIYGKSLEGYIYIGSLEFD